MSWYLLLIQSTMTQAVLPQPKRAFTVTPPAETSPFLIEFFVVQGPNFRCVAYCDQEGCWHNAFNNEELFGDIQILE